MADGFNTDDMLDVYLFENQQLLEKLQKTVLEQKEKECFDEDVIHEIFRTMHTMKASSAVMMFDEITSVSHKLEDIFFVLRESHPKNVPHIQLIEHILNVVDFITNELQKIENGESVNGDASEIISCLDVFLTNVKEKCGIDSEVQELNNESVTQKFYIAPIIDLESSVEEIEARVERERARERIRKEVKSKDFVPGDFVIQAKAPGKEITFAKDSYKSGKKTTFMNVDITKMDQLMDLIVELGHAQSDVVHNPDLNVPGISLDNFHESVDKMIRLSTELQNVVLSMRLVPLTSIFQKMNRIVFDISRKLGKDVEFVMIGDAIEVDKNIIEHISDPLMHLVRNAVDHGIETLEEKAATGKTERSKVTLSAKIESEKIWITVEDNGKGLDRNKIINKARKQGVFDDGKPESAYTDKEVFQFITLPGFSTKEKVTEYSGRGVGMDVVLSNIASIGGSLEIESEKGIGSRMIMKIPLTLAVVDGIVMKVGK